MGICASRSGGPENRSEDDATIPRQRSTGKKKGRETMHTPIRSRTLQYHPGRRQRVMSLLAPSDTRSSSKEDLSVDELTAGMQKLPTELFDLIYDLTFTTDTSIRRIDGKYKPPAILQVDRTSRALAASSYYYNNTFVFRMNPYYIQDVYGRSSKSHSTNWGRLWLMSLPSDHCKALAEVHLISSIRGMQLETASMWMSMLSFEDLGLSPKQQAVERFDWGTKIIVRLKPKSP